MNFATWAHWKNKLKYFTDLAQRKKRLKKIVRTLTQKKQIVIWNVSKK